MPAFIRDLLVITPQVVTALWISAGLALLCALHWRGRRRAASGLAAIVALVMLPVAIGDSVNAHYQYLPRVADVVNIPTWPTASRQAVDLAAKPGKYPRGAVVTLSIPGPSSGFGTHKALVYLPPQYFTEPTRRFPVIYLIHGSPGAPVDWFRAARAADTGLAVALAGTPVLLVAPRASRGWSDDSECVDRPREKVQTYLAVDVVRSTDAQLRTLSDREHRALAGNSAGGFCALNVGLRHRDRFSVLIDLSGYDHPTYAGGLARLFGPRSPLTRATADTPADYARWLSAQPRMHIWLDYGRADRVPRQDALRMSRLLRAAGQDVVLRSRTGGHDYGVWRPALRTSLRWAAARLGGPTDPSRPASAVR
jgi:enterochelin esterase-like enzyme